MPKHPDFESTAGQTGRRAVLQAFGFQQPAPVPLVGIAKRLGEVDFASLILARGLETKILVEAIVASPNGPRHGYRQSSIGVESHG